MSKKKILNALLLACFFAMFIGMQMPAQAQQNVGIGITTPDASAILDLTATDKGMLVPRMNTAQRTAIATPATGLLVYDTDFAMFWYFDGTQWIPISAGMQGPTGPTGTAGVAGPTGPQGTQGPIGPTGEAGDHYATTSTDCITIGTGTFNITVATGLAYTAGQSIVVAFDVNNKLEGVVVSYDPMTGAMTILIGTATGAGTYCLWGVNLNGTPGIQGPAGPQGIAGVAGAQGATGPTGATGLTGAVGPQGPIGPQGIQGVQGPQGIQGVQGPVGPTGPGNVHKYYVIGTTDATIPCNAAPNGFVLMPQMTLTFTPQNSSVLMYFTAAGTYTTTEFAGHSIWFEVRVNGTSIREWDTNCGIDWNLWEMGVSTPLTVTPGVSTTITIYWDAQRGGTINTTINNLITSGTYFNRALMIVDAP
jgi:hypothetical protein